MKVSIIIPTLNEKEHIEKVLRNWLNQTYKNIEIVIVDGGSTDGTIRIIEKLSKHHPNIKLLIRKDAYPPQARNIGVEKASGEIIVLMDADIASVNDKFIESAIVHFKDENVIGVDPKFIPTKCTWVESAIIYPREGAEDPVEFYIHPHLIRRSVFLDLGGYPLVGGEDILLADKINALTLITSKKVILEDKSVCHFHVPHTLKEFWKQQRWYGRAFPSRIKARGEEPIKYVEIYFNVALAYSIFFVFLIPIFPILAIILSPLFLTFLWYLIKGVKSSAVKIFMAKFLLYLIGGFARGIGLLEAGVRKRARVGG